MSRIVLGCLGAGSWCRTSSHGDRRSDSMPGTPHVIDCHCLEWPCIFACDSDRARWQGSRRAQGWTMLDRGISFSALCSLCTCPSALLMLWCVFVDSTGGTSCGGCGPGTGRGLTCYRRGWTRRFRRQSCWQGRSPAFSMADGKLRATIGKKYQSLGSRKADLKAVAIAVASVNAHRWQNPASRNTADPCLLPN